MDDLAAIQTRFSVFVERQDMSARVLPTEAGSTATVLDLYLQHLYPQHAVYPWMQVEIYAREGDIPKMLDTGNLHIFPRATVRFGRDSLEVRAAKRDHFGLPGNLGAVH